MTPILVSDNLDDHARLVEMMRTLETAVSWSADHRSQLPTLRYVDADGARRIVSMEGALPRPGNGVGRDDAPQAVADAMRHGAIAAMRIAASGPVDQELADEAQRRLEAFAVLCSATMGILRDDTVILTAGCPWRPASAKLVASLGGRDIPTDLDELGIAHLCPSMFGISTGDDFSLRDVSLGLFARQHALLPHDAMEGFRAARLLGAPWNAA